MMGGILEEEKMGIEQKKRKEGRELEKRRGVLRREDWEEVERRKRKEERGMIGIGRGRGLGRWEGIEERKIDQKKEEYSIRYII